MQQCIESFAKCLPLEVADKCLPAPPAQAVGGKKHRGSRAPEPIGTVKPPYHGQRRLTASQYDAAVAAPTPPQLWWTPRTGWPKKVAYAGGRPADLMPTAVEAPDDFFLPQSEALGELRVELLETDGLKQVDGAFDQNDVYAMVVFEDNIATTKVIENVNDPRWHSECARAFRFPIYAAHSTLRIALLDSDEKSWSNVLDGLEHLVDGVEGNTTALLNNLSPAKKNGKEAAGASSSSSAEAARPDAPTAKEESDSTTTENEPVAAAKDRAAASLDSDDPIGRIELSLSKLHPETIYDGWFELRSSAAFDDAGPLGALRLRYSIVWTVPERRRLKSYLSPPPSFVVPLVAPTETEARRRVLYEALQFALHGEDHDDGKYNFYILLEHAFEVKAHLMGAFYAVYDFVEGLVLYKNPRVSILAGLFWQATCSYPFLLPSYVPLAALALMHANYLNMRESLQGVHAATLTPRDLLAALLLPSLKFWKARRLPPAAACAPLWRESRRLTHAEVLKQRTERDEAKAKALAVAAAAKAKLEADLQRMRQLRVAKNVVGDLGRGALDFGSDVLSDIGSGVGDTLSDAGKQLQQGKVLSAGSSVVANTTRTALTTSARALRTAIKTVRGALDLVGSTADQVELDPLQLLKPKVHWVQESLGAKLPMLRGIAGVLCWDDPSLSSWLCLVLLVLALGLPWLPWLYIARTFGALALGPHMWYVGASQRRAAKFAAEHADDGDNAALRYADSKTGDARRALLESEEKRRADAALAEERAAEAALNALPFSDHAHRRRTYEGGISVVVPGSRVTAVKMEMTPCPMRSRAAPSFY